MTNCLFYIHFYYFLSCNHSGFCPAERIAEPEHRLGLDNSNSGESPARRRAGHFACRDEITVLCVLAAERGFLKSRAPPEEARAMTPE